jgi:hypothetical protein
MSNDIDAKSASELNKRSGELVQHFRDFAKECQQEHPELTDMNTLFHTWAIDRIAGLEHLALNLTERVIALEQGRRKS